MSQKDWKATSKDNKESAERDLENARQSGVEEKIKIAESTLEAKKQAYKKAKQKYNATQLDHTLLALIRT